MQLCIMFKSINFVNNKRGKMMSVDTFYKADSLERRNISITFKDMASL